MKKSVKENGKIVLAKNGQKELSIKSEPKGLKITISQENVYTKTIDFFVTFKNIDALIGQLHATKTIWKEARLEELNSQMKHLEEELKNLSQTD